MVTEYMLKLLGLDVSFPFSLVLVLQGCAVQCYSNGLKCRMMNFPELPFHELAKAWRNPALCRET